MTSVWARCALTIVLAAVLLLTALLLACVVSAESGPVQLSVTPDSLALSPGEKATVLILASVPAATTDPLKPATITLTSFTGSGVDTRLLSRAKQKAPPPGGSISWMMEITAKESGVSPGPLYLTAIVEGAAAAGQQTITRTEIARLGITGRPAEAITEVLSVTLHSDIETLLDLRQRNAILVVTNIGSVPVNITKVVPTLTSTQAKQLSAGTTFAGPLMLRPQQAAEIPIRLKVGSAVESGENLLVVRVDAGWKRGDLDRQGSAVLTESFQSGVFGETAILTAVGIPALILLPGFLMMVGFALFYRALRPPPEGAPEPELWSLKGDLALAKPKVWFWAIGFSLLLFLAYPWISGWFLTWASGEKVAGRNLLTGYGFVDIVYLWIVAALAGLLVAAIAVLAPQGARSLQRAWLGRRTPAPDDCEMDVLKKLVRNGNPDFRVENCKYENQDVFKLPAALHVPGKVWVTPRIQVFPAARLVFAAEFNKGTERQAKSEADLLACSIRFGEVFQTIDDGHSKAGLKELQKLKNMGWVDLRFEPGVGMPRPTLIDEATFQANFVAGGEVWLPVLEFRDSS
jgi:hypothetical protein